MGCICGKPSHIRDSRETTTSTRAVPQSEASSVGERREKQQLSGYDAERRREKERERERAASYLRHSHGQSQRDTIGAISKAVLGEQVAAGWPPWLAAVAGEAIHGWVPRRADSFEKLDKVSNFAFTFLIFIFNIFIFLVSRFGLTSPRIVLKGQNLILPLKCTFCIQEGKILAIVRQCLTPNTNR